MQYPCFNLFGAACQESPRVVPLPGPQIRISFFLGQITYLEFWTDLNFFSSSERLVELARFSAQTQPAQVALAAAQMYSTTEAFTHGVAISISASSSDASLHPST